MTNTASVSDPTIPAREPLRVLLVPADPARQVGVITVACSAAGLSAAIGGHLIDDGAIGVLPGGVEFGHVCAVTCWSPGCGAVSPTPMCRTR